MTDSEALEVLGYLLGHEKAVDSGELGDVQNCLNSQEQEALSVILSEFRELKEKELSGLELAKIVCSIEKLKKYEAIGTVERFKELDEKQMSKSMILKRGIYHCCSCGMAFEEFRQGYCFSCGQHLY